MNDAARRAQYADAPQEQVRGCFGKQKLPSKKVATGVARAVERALGQGRMNAYKCKWCRCWHVGHAVSARLRESAWNGPEDR